MRAETVGTKIIFAGGDIGQENSTTADVICDTETGEWTTSGLTASDNDLLSASTEDFAIFVAALEEYEDRIGTAVDLYEAGNEVITRAMILIK